MQPRWSHHWDQRGDPSPNGQAKRATSWRNATTTTATAKHSSEEMSEKTKSRKLCPKGLWVVEANRHRGPSAIQSKVSTDRPVIERKWRHHRCVVRAYTRPPIKKRWRRVGQFHGTQATKQRATATQRRHDDSKAILINRRETKGDERRKQCRAHVKPWATHVLPFVAPANGSMLDRRSSRRKKTIGRLNEWSPPKECEFIAWDAKDEDCLVETR